LLAIDNHRKQAAERHRFNGARRLKATTKTAVRGNHAGWKSSHPDNSPHRAVLVLGRILIVIERKVGTRERY